ncbi:MAG: SLC13 family permease [Sediminicola sp.]|tara:strand:- start:22844 stop:24658 length:1815 start_codon:yes stop_codon:yes gene_type:complete
MTIEIVMVFLVLFTTVLFFALELFPIDKISFFIIVSLSILQLVSPEEAISGFSNPATITVLALMMLAIAMEENGVINWLVSGLGKVKSLPLYLMAPIFMFVTAGISAFISTTAVVIVFIKIITELKEKYNISQAKLLLPISFAGILGGSCTLMGTSTNLIVNSVAQDLGAPKLSFFEFSGMGLIFLVISVILITIAIQWLPWGKNHTIKEDYGLDNFITTVKINNGSNLVGKTIEETFLHDNADISLLKLTRNNRMHNAPGKYITLREDDTLLLMCDLKNLTKLNQSENLTIYEGETFPPEQGTEEKENQESRLNKRTFIELLVLPGSSLLGKTLGMLRSSLLQNSIPIAIKKRKTLTKTNDRLVRNSRDTMVLKPGDRLLVEMEKEKVGALAQLENVVVLQELGGIGTTSKYKKYFSLCVLLLVIGLAATGVLSILISSLTGVFLLLFTKNLDLNEVYKKVNWQIIFLLAGMIPLGTAMHNSGADIWISEQLLGVLGNKADYIVIGSLFFVTMIMSGVVSNNATAIIMTPIALAVAQGMDMDVKPFILAVMFAANFSFFTPMGYQTNTLIYGMGDYKFKHFFILGGVLSLVLWLVATILLSTL